MKANGDLGIPETKLLAALMRHNGQYVPIADLAAEIGQSTSSVATSVRFLRVKYGASIIESKKRYGYRVNPKVWQSFKEAS